MMNSNSDANESSNKPWYRQFWPWFIMLPPAGAVIGGIITIYLAFSNQPELVVDDYGSIDNTTAQRLAREQTAADMGLLAEVNLSRDTTGSFYLKVSLQQAGNAGELPEMLRATLIHSTKSEFDRSVDLLRSEGLYQGQIEIPASNYYLQLENPERTWRLVRRLPVGLGTFTISPRDKTA
jgi:hypothetical protein